MTCLHIQYPPEHIISNRHSSDSFAAWDPTACCMNTARDKTYWPVGGPLVSASARRFSQPVDFRLKHEVRLENWHWCKISGVFLSWDTLLPRSSSRQPVLWSTLVGIHNSLLKKHAHGCALLSFVVVEHWWSLIIYFRVASWALG